MERKQYSYNDSFMVLTLVIVRSTHMFSIRYTALNSVTDRKRVGSDNEP